jgi:hypothetical protein
MIEVPLPYLVLIPLVVNLLLLFGFHAYYSARRVAKRARRRPTRIYRCQLCQHVYIDSRDVPLARCNRCGCLNEAVRR